MKTLLAFLLVTTCFAAHAKRYELWQTDVVALKDVKQLSALRVYSDREIEVTYEATTADALVVDASGKLYRQKKNEKKKLIIPKNEAGRIIDTAITRYPYTSLLYVSFDQNCNSRECAFVFSGTGYGFQYERAPQLAGYKHIDTEASCSPWEKLTEKTEYLKPVLEYKSTEEKPAAVVTTVETTAEAPTSPIYAPSTVQAAE